MTTEASIVRLTIPAKAEYITLCRLALAGISHLREIGDETLHDLKLALTEACTNSVRHAYDAGNEGSVQIVYELGEEDISIEVIDEGEGFVLDEASETDRISEAGSASPSSARSPTSWRSSRGRAAARGCASSSTSEPRRRGSAQCSSRSTSAHKSLRDYATLATRGLMEQIRSLSEPLAGKRVLHLSATAFGGGVAEINYTLIPLMSDAGLDTEWRIIHGADEFFEVTKTIHNALQGNPQASNSAAGGFRGYNALNAAQIEEGEYDFTVSSSSTCGSVTTANDWRSPMSARHALDLP